jgi:membrane fusion protein (multidrug efflux system)
MADDTPARPADSRAEETESRQRERDERETKLREDQRRDRRGEASGDVDKRGGRPPQRRRMVLLIGLIILLVIVVVGAIYWYLTRNQVSTDDAFIDGRAVMISPHLSAYVTELAVNDNQRVRKGDLLVQLEQSNYLAARNQAAGQLTAAEAQLDSARAFYEKAQTMYPAQLEQAQGQLEQAQGQLYLAQSEYDRQHSLPRAATSQQSIDASTANLQQAQGQVKQAEAQVKQAGLVQQNLEQARAQVAQLEGQVQQARAALDQAEINLGYTRITAPQDGWVTKRNVEMGNFVQSGVQIMAVVAPEVWVTANFKETQLDGMRPGQQVRIRVDAYPELKLAGHVDSIQLGSGSRFSAFPPENATGNFVKIVQRVPVKLDIDSGLDPSVPLPLGVSVVPTVLVE